jgi:carotenoid cleavage dioxygenase-like enzyme
MSPPWVDKNHMGMTGSAHPLRRPGSEDEFVAIVVEKDFVPFGPDKANPVIGVYSINVKTMERSFIGHVPVKTMQFLHSYGVSRNYVVLPMNAAFDPSPIAVKLITEFTAAWDGVHVLNMNTKQVQVFQTKMFYHAHVINTFENATGIVMDLNTWDNVPFNPHEVGITEYTNKTERDQANGVERIERMHFHLTGPMQGQVTRQVLTQPGRVVDFMRINDLMTGKPYCSYYAVEWFHDDKTHASMALFKHDICQGTKTYWAKEYQYPHEPVFIPLNATDADAEEDHGLLVFLSLNGPRAGDDFVILDAKTFQEIVVVQLEARSPFLAHAQFVPKAAQEAAKSALAVEHPQLAAAIDTTFVV